MLAKRALAVAALMFATDGAAATALAQNSPYHVPNSYQDFPYNQGSLFYAPRGANAPTRAVRTARRPLFQRRRVQRAGSYYQAPQGAYTTAPQYYYPAGTAAPRYYYPAGTNAPVYSYPAGTTAPVYSNPAGR